MLKAAAAAEILGPDKEPTMGDDLLGTAQIAELLGLSQKHVTDRLTKEPTFPAPAVAISRKTKRWRRADVEAWAAPQSSREAISSAVVR